MHSASTVDPDVIFHEPLNPSGPNFERTVEAARGRGEDELADAIAALDDDRAWRDYAIEQLRWVHELGRDLELPVYCWPDEDLTSGSYSEYAEWWRDQESPERFGGREPEWEIPPAVPTCAPETTNTTLTNF